jgi:hypothetical protein
VVFGLSMLLLACRPWQGCVLKSASRRHCKQAQSAQWRWLFSPMHDVSPECQA